MSMRPVVVVASPDAAEVALLSDWLRAEGLEPLAARSLQAAMYEVRSRTYDVLIADAAFAFEGDLQSVARNHNARAPLVVVGGDDATRARSERNGTFHIARPVDQTLLLCRVAMAIAEGRPARRSERKRITPFEAVVEGSQAYIVDISNEGLRLVLPRRRLAPAPHFAFRVPLIGVALTVRRVWMSAAPVEHSDAAWCGVELYQPNPRAAQSWRTFVSTVSGR
jgi:DNA-binding response OmpR family regulator